MANHETFTLDMLVRPPAQRRRKAPSIDVLGRAPRLRPSSGQPIPSRLLSANPMGAGC